jgi:alpha-ribazole phosphatase/probable phosphoglycerate mutase
MDLILVRHGETLSNIKKIYAGKGSESLTRRGRQQAADAAEKLKNNKIDALYSSPIKRAVETAEIIGRSVGLSVNIQESFREMELGPWEGLSEDDINLKYPDEWRIWQNTPAELKLPGRETLDELLKRVTSCIRKILQVENYRKIAVVTHVAIIRVLILYREKKSLNLYKTIHVPNAGIFNIRMDATTFPP